MKYQFEERCPMIISVVSWCMSLLHSCGEIWDSISLKQWFSNFSVNQSHLSDVLKTGFWVHFQSLCCRKFGVGSERFHYCWVPTWCWRCSLETTLENHCPRVRCLHHSWDPEYTMEAGARVATDITKLLCMRQSKRYVFAIVKEENEEGRWRERSGKIKIAWGWGVR